MSNSKLIIIEGAQGVGKTTITDFIRNSVPYTNLYRLNGTADSTASGKEKSKKMYMGLMDYIKTLENLNINLLFDRTFFSEEIYCRLGFKEYSFTDIYNELLDILSKMDFDIFYITLYLDKEDEFEKRLMREGKATTKYAKFDKRNSILQQNAYLRLSDEVKEKYPNIHVIKFNNLIPLEEAKKQLLEILS